MLINITLNILYWFCPFKNMPGLLRTTPTPATCPENIQVGYATVGLSLTLKTE